MLRGTHKKKQYAILNARPTLRNELNALKAKVNRQKPETQYYRTDGLIDSAAIGYSLHQIPVTTNLIGTADFRNNVTGDLWANLRIKVRARITPDCHAARCIIYVPKKPGQRFTPNNFGQYPDPTAFWVLADEMPTIQYDGGTSNSTKQSTLWEKNVSLRNLITHYNSDSGVLERGEVMVMFCVETQDNTADLIRWGYELTFHNK